MKVKPEPDNGKKLKRNAPVLVLRLEAHKKSDISLEEYVQKIRESFKKMHLDRVFLTRAFKDLNAYVETVENGIRSGNTESSLKALLEMRSWQGITRDWIQGLLNKSREYGKIGSKRVHPSAESIKERDQKWQERINVMNMNNPRRSHRQLCVSLSKELKAQGIEIAPRTIENRTLNPKKK